MKEVREGDVIKIIYMEGEPCYEGKIGIVEMIDDAGQIHGSWGGCAVIPETDEFEVVMNISEEEKEYFIYLEGLRRSGVTNMYGAVPYLIVWFGIDISKATEVLSKWMKNYKTIVEVLK